MLRLLGYEIEYLPLSGEGIDPEARLAGVLARAKDEIRAGRPALLWHDFTMCEWDVVCGFEDQTGELFGRGSYLGLDGYALAADTRAVRCLDICPALGAILVGDKVGRFDATAAEIAALEEAVRHAHSRANEDQRDGDEWVMLDGLLCYERWVESFRSSSPGASDVPGTGDRYCTGVYRSTHRAASGFLLELAPKFAGAREHFRGGAGAFAGEADALDACYELLFSEGALPTEPGGARNARTAEVLAGARDHYARGIEAIGAALAAIGA